MKPTSLGLALAVGLGSALVAGDASAFEFGTPESAHPFRSPQNFAFELRFSPYKPRIDEEPGLKGTPFKDRFGDKPRLYIGAELDWQIFRIPYVGTIGPGLGVGLVTMSRQSTTLSGRASGDEYSLTIYPFYLSAVLRADVFWRDAGIPLVPYGKAGLGYGLWRSSNSTGTSVADGVTGKGASLGWQGALGISLALDALDVGASRNMDNATGINGTYLYAEYYILNLDGFGSPDKLRVGTASWAAGLAFEF